METLLLIIMAIATAFLFLFAGVESGLFALSRLRVRQQTRAGNRRAATLNGYLADSEGFLRTVATGVSLFQVLAIGCAILLFYKFSRHAPGLFPFVLVAAGIVFYVPGSVLPRVLFQIYPNRLCIFLAPFFWFLALPVKPLEWLVARVAAMPFSPLRGRPFRGKVYGTRDELRLMMQETPGLTNEERAMIHHVLDLQNLSVKQVSVPISKVATVSTDTPVSEVLAIYRERGFSRLPVWKVEASRRYLAGLVDLSSLIFEEELDETKKAEDVLSPCVFFPAEMRLEVALRELQRTNQRLAIVKDRDGTELGIVSLQDILKVIFGEVSL